MSVVVPNVSATLSVPDLRVEMASSAMEVTASLASSRLLLIRCWRFSMSSISFSRKSCSFLMPPAVGMGSSNRPIDETPKNTMSRLEDVCGDWASARTATPCLAAPFCTFQSLIDNTDKVRARLDTNENYAQANLGKKIKETIRRLFLFAISDHKRVSILACPPYQANVSRYHRLFELYKVRQHGCLALYKQTSKYPIDKGEEFRGLPLETWVGWIWEY